MPIQDKVQSSTVIKSINNTIQGSIKDNFLNDPQKAKHTKLTQNNIF